MTLDHYGHLYESDLDDVAERLDKVSVPKPCPRSPMRPRARQLRKPLT
jgi:hypothetical protein